MEHIEPCPILFPYEGNVTELALGVRTRNQNALLLSYLRRGRQGGVLQGGTLDLMKGEALIVGELLVLQHWLVAWSWVTDFTLSRLNCLTHIMGSILRPVPHIQVICKKKKINIYWSSTVCQTNHENNQRGICESTLHIFIFVIYI